MYKSQYTVVLEYFLVLQYNNTGTVLEVYCTLNILLNSLVESSTTVYYED
jgi:hypothetical protein